MGKGRKREHQLSLELKQASQSDTDHLPSARQKGKIVNFVDAGTRATRQDAIKRVQASGAFAERSKR
jgi:hypothetical protein